MDSSGELGPEPQCNHYLQKGDLKIGRLLIRGYIINIGAILAVCLAMYFPGLDVLLAFLYLLIVWKEGQYCRLILNNRAQRAIIAIIWQLPGYLLAGAILCSLDAVSQFGYYFIFMLELWDTPILPLMSLLPVWTILDRPLYYYLLFIVVPLMSLYYYLPRPLTGPQKSRSAGSI